MIVYLVGNKSDLNDMREVRKDEAMTKSEKYNIAFFTGLCYNVINYNNAFTQYHRKE